MADITSVTTFDFAHFTQNRKYIGLEEENEDEWRGPFCFIQAADTQFGMIEDYVEKKPNPQWTKEIILFKKAIRAVNKIQPRPRFFIVCGDLVHAFPGYENNLPQIVDFKKVFSELHPDIKPICVCGNHDVGDIPTVDSMQHYINNFGDDYFTFWVGGVFCLVLNSQFYVNSSLVEDLKKKQDQWLDEQLAAISTKNCKHVIVFQHVPPFVKEADEAKIYFNLEINLRKEFLAKLKKAGVKTIFCGHYHRNSIGFDDTLEVIVTSAVGAQLGDDTHGLRIVRVFEDSIRHHYYSLDDIPEKVEL